MGFPEETTLEAAAPIAIEWLKPDPLLTPDSSIAGIARAAKADSARKEAKPFSAVGTSLKRTGAAEPGEVDRREVDERA